MNSNEITQMDAYRKIIQDRLASRSREFVENSSSDHASVIIEEMIHSARFSFHAYAQAMCDDVWNDRIITALELALHRGVSVRIVVSERCIPLDKGAMPPAVADCIFKSGYSKEVGDQLNHFAVVDGRVLRWETNARERTAEFSADAGALAKTAEELFGRLLAQGIPCVGEAA